MKSLTPKELNSLLESENNIQLLDVREKWEHDEFNIGGLNIPLGEVIKRMHEIDESKNVIIYCEKGIRSAIAIQKLEKKGIKDLSNLVGGMNRWKKDIN